MRGWIAWAVLVATTATAAVGAEVKTFSIQSAKGFLEGTLDGVSVDEAGIVALADRAERVAVLGEPFAFALAALPDGWAVGTGNEGRVLRVGADGETSVLFDAEEPVVFALWADPDGTLFAGTSPNGKVYRIRNGAAEPFYDPGETYIWAIARSGDGALWVATGTEGRLYRVDEKGHGEIAFDSEETHLRSLLPLPGGDLLVGTAPEGLVLRWNASASRARTVYDSALSEVVAFAPAGDGAAWAAVLASESSFLDAAPARAKPGTGKQGGESKDAGDEDEPVVVVVEAGGASSVTGSRSAGATGPRSELVRILPSGVVEPIWSSSDETVFALQADGERLWMGTGLEGKLYRFENDRPRVEKDLEERQVVGVVPGPSGPAVLTTNAAALWRFAGGPEKRGTYTSAALDAGQAARFGVFRWRGEAPDGTSVRVAFRSGSSSDPDRTWSEWSKSFEGREVSLAAIPGGRFVQFRVELEGADGATPRLNSAELSYRQENLRPKIERFWSMDPGKILVPTGFNPGEQVFEPASPNRDGIFTTLEPASARDERFKTVWKKGWRTLRWKTSDPNEDSLRHALSVRPEGSQGEWIPMVDDLDATHWSFDSTVLPDGLYRFRLVADDRTDNESGGLEASEVSEPVLIDHTPPVLGKVRRTGGGARIEVYDATSPLREARISVDGKEWKPIGVADGMLDGSREVLVLDAIPENAGLILLRVGDAAFNERTFDLGTELGR